MSVDKNARTTTAECPDCGDRITLTLPVRRGDLINCPNCEAELEIIGTDPVELDWVYEEWDDEEEESDDW